VSPTKWNYSDNSYAEARQWHRATSQFRPARVLTTREDLIEQRKRHVQEFNTSRNDLYIRLRELKEYAEAKRESPSLFGAREMTVFYYRSDNLSDEQKERIIDFRNYDDNGKWYVLLDEAHKGDEEDSKRQHISMEQ